MRLSFGVIVGATGQIMHAAVNLDSNARFAHGEVYGVPADLVLPHDVNAFATQQAKRLPSPQFASTHADASLGCFRARLISQAPSRIIGIESSMPMVTTPRSASGMCASGSRTVSNSARKSP